MAAKSGRRGKPKPKPDPAASLERPDPTCPTVAIGSSAGGIMALQTLFEGMPTDLNVAFVVVAHLEPTRPSELVPILQRRTKMGVVQVTGETPLQPNCVYVIAPNTQLEINDRFIASHPFDEPRG